MRLKYVAPFMCYFLSSWGIVISATGVQLKDIVLKHVGCSMFALGMILADSLKDQTDVRNSSS